MKHTTAEEKQSFQEKECLLQVGLIMNAEKTGQILQLKEERLEAEEDRGFSIPQIFFV